MDTDTRAGLDLGELESDHSLRESYYRGRRVRECGTCCAEWPCTTARLVAEVRRLAAVADAARELLRDCVVGFDLRSSIRKVCVAAAALDSPAPPHVAPEAAERGKEGS